MCHVIAKGVVMTIAIAMSCLINQSDCKDCLAVRWRRDSTQGTCCVTDAGAERHYSRVDSQKNEPCVDPPECPGEKASIQDCTKGLACQEGQ